MIPILKNIPDVEDIEPTLLEIGGYPHYENIISNILAFYIDFTNNHGLGDLIYKSLYQLIVEDGNYKMPNSIDIEREVYVGNGRIDILIITDELIIGIENKIKDKKGDNPLEEYEAYINQLPIEEEKEREKNRFGVILSVWNKKPRINFFKNIVYEKLFKKIRENDKQKLLKSENLYIKFLSELITTIERIKNKNEMKKNELSYLIENKNDIIKLNKLLSKYFTDIRIKLNDLRENLKIEDYTTSSKIWIDKEVKNKLNGVALYNLKTLGQADSMELKARLAPGGWSIEFWKTTKLSDEKSNILKEISKSDFQIKNEKKYITIYSNSYTTKTSELKRIIESSLKELYKT